MTVLSTDPFEVVKNVLETNMDSPDGVWTPSVNEGWLEHKHMKSYQIALQPRMMFDEAVHLTGDGAARAVATTQYMDITLYAPTRAKRWNLYRSVKAVLNDGSVCVGDGSAGSGPDNSDVHWVVLSGIPGGGEARWLDDECGPFADADSCKGWRVVLTVAIRWNE